MIEELKEKAVQAMFDKIGETVESDEQSLTGLVKFERLDSEMGHSKNRLGRIQSDFVGLYIYLDDRDFDKVGDTMTVRGVEYDVVKQQSKVRYNGFAQVELTEITQAPANNSIGWR